MMHILCNKLKRSCLEKSGNTDIGLLAVKTFLNDLLSPVSRPFIIAECDYVKSTSDTKKSGPDTPISEPKLLSNT